MVKIFIIFKSPLILDIILMKRFMTYFLLLMLVFTACTNVDKETENKPPDPAAEKAAIKLLLEKYIIANETGNISIIEDIWANDSSVYTIGTDRNEELRGYEAVKEKFVNQFNIFENTYISSRDQVIYISPGCNAAWFSEVLQYNFTIEDTPREYSDLRFTGFAEKRDGKWKLVHTHLSAPLR